ncbi:MAG: methyltransferase, partial [Actinomycetota bacterium]|nr:methyltransferase [Actinomycetota bacterium]
MGEVSFKGLGLTTAPGRVMTPRAASEQVVAAALARLEGGPARVADVGTGSGALAIAIASVAPQAVLWATDTSRDAVALARANVRRHRLADRITVCHGDLLEPVTGAVDLVVANLPYLAAAEAALFPDLASEPVDAVFVAGDGLEPYRRLLTVCAGRLSIGGAVAIQLHRRVLTATHDELPRLRAEIETTHRAAALSLPPQVLA